jgi:hypothetical protein
MFLVGLPEQVDPSRGEAISTIIYIVVFIVVVNVLAVVACARAGRRLSWIRDQGTQAIGPLGAAQRARPPSALPPQTRQRAARARAL